MKLSMGLAAGMLALSLTHAAYAGAIADPTALQQRLDKLSQGHDARVGICAQDQSGTTVCVNGDARFSLQSVMKLAASAAALDAADRNTFNIDAQFAIKRENLSLNVQPLAKIVERDGVFYTTAGDLILRSVAYSDSAAVDNLIERLGGPEKVDQFLASKNIHGIRIDRDERHQQTEITGLRWKPEYTDPKVLQKAIHDVPESKRDAAFLAYQKDPRDTATPRSVTLLLAGLMNGKLLSPASNQRLLAAMGQTVTFPDRLRAGAPKGWSVANKTGTSRTWKGLSLATNDVGILTAPDGGKIAIAVFVADSRETPKKRATIIAAAARAVAEAYR